MQGACHALLFESALFLRRAEGLSGKSTSHPLKAVRGRGLAQTQLLHLKLQATT